MTQYLLAVHGPAERDEFGGYASQEEMEAAFAATAAGQHPAAAADVHTVRSVFEAEDPDRRGLAEALSRIPYGFDALDAVGYTGALSIESFTARNASIATTASIWRPLAESQDQLAEDGLAFLRSCAARPPGGHP